MVKKEWNRIIEEKLKDGMTIEDLVEKYPDGILMEPNVTLSDLTAYDHEVKVTKNWVNMAEIKAGDAIEKNTLILKALQEGANGLSIVITAEDNVETVLKGVLTEYLDIRMDMGALAKGEEKSKISVFDQKKFPTIRWVSDEGTCKVHRITETDRIASIQGCLQSVQRDQCNDILVTVGKNILYEIASLRAIRVLLDRKGCSKYNILCTYETEGANTLGDYNLIEKTYKVLSGVLGGADAILTDYRGDEESRLTLNIHNILDLESGMKHVLDPVKGSYYIEKLTGEIIRQVDQE